MNHSKIIDPNYKDDQIIEVPNDNQSLEDIKIKFINKLKNKKYLV